MPILSLILNAGWLIPAEASNNCFRTSPKPVTAHVLRTRYKFFKGSPVINGSQPTGDPSVGYCNWNYVTNYDAKRIPNDLLEARLNCTPMPACSYKCSPVTYNHNVLEKTKCDYRTGMVVWKWIQVQLAIAYVYDVST